MRHNLGFSNYMIFEFGNRLNLFDKEGWKFQERCLLLHPKI